jgi:hypothetical protein
VHCRPIRRRVWSVDTTRHGACDWMTSCGSRYFLDKTRKKVSPTPKKVQFLILSQSPGNSSSEAPSRTGHTEMVCCNMNRNPKKNMVKIFCRFRSEIGLVRNCTVQYRQRGRPLSLPSRTIPSGPTFHRLSSTTNSCSLLSNSMCCPIPTPKCRSAEPDQGRLTVLPRIRSGILGSVSQSADFAHAQLSNREERRQLCSMLRR